MTNLEVLTNFTNEPLKGKLPDKELRSFLVTPDLTESDGTRTESVRLLDSSRGNLSVEILTKMRVATTVRIKRTLEALPVAIMVQSCIRGALPAWKEGKRKNELSEKCGSGMDGNPPPVDLRAVCYVDD